MSLGSERGRVKLIVQLSGNYRVFGTPHGCWHEASFAAHLSQGSRFAVQAGAENLVGFRASAAVHARVTARRLLSDN